MNSTCIGSGRNGDLFQVTSYDMVKNSSARTGGASENLTSDIESGQPVWLDSRVSCKFSNAVCRALKIFLSARNNSTIPHPNQIPTDLIPYYLETDNQTSVFYDFQDVAFPAPITYNYESKTWNSIYTNKPYKDWGPLIKSLKCHDTDMSVS